MTLIWQINIRSLLLMLRLSSDFKVFIFLFLIVFVLFQSVKIQDSNIDRLGYLNFFRTLTFIFLFTFILNIFVQKQDCVELCI